MKKVISSRLTPELIDKLASVLSSNCCVNYFGILVKLLQGKRLNQDQTDTWRVLQAFVTGLRINPYFTYAINEAAGISPSKLRVYKRKAVAHFNKYNKERATKKHVIFRQRVKMQVRAHLMGKEENKTARRKTEKINPKESAIQMSVIKKLEKCGNCGVLGHTKLQCAEPEYVIEKNRSTAINNVANLFK